MQVETYNDYKQKYQDYLVSDHWVNLRKQKLVLVRHQCEACSSQKRLQVHHIHYRSLYDCDTDDLVALCKTCHGMLHQAFKINGTKPSHYSRKETIALIHRFCERQGIPVGQHGNRAPAKSRIIRAYQKCRKASYTRASLATMIQELEIVLLTMTPPPQPTNP
jgi:hypothetical protein